MTNENTRDLGGMHIDIFSPQQEAHTKVVIPKMTHGANIAIIQSGDEDLSDCDALITENRSLTLGIKTGDCAPVCFSDGNTIGIAHVGWPGLCLGLIEKMLPYFETRTLTVYVAPFIHSFEIQKDFCYERIHAKFHGAYVEEQADKLIFNFKNAIASLLPAQTIFDSRDTLFDAAFPSNRRDKTKERYLTAISFSV